MTAARGKKVGIMISADSGGASFERGLAAAEAAIRNSAQVYLYLIDNAVTGLGNPRIKQLKDAGVHLYACAYSLQRRHLNAPPEATLAGLTILSDVIASAEDFQSYN
jgi:hypothetical protein